MRLDNDPKILFIGTPIFLKSKNVPIKLLYY